MQEWIDATATGYNGGNEVDYREVLDNGKNPKQNKKQAKNKAKKATTKNKTKIVLVDVLYSLI